MDYPSPMATRPHESAPPPVPRSPSPQWNYSSLPPRQVRRLSSPQRLSPPLPVDTLPWQPWPEQSRVILGLDFGTTYTSVAYLSDSRTKGDNDDPIKKIENIRTVMNWPTHESSRVPSEISYTPSPTGRRQWGHDIDDRAQVHKHIRTSLEDLPRDQELESLAELLYRTNVNLVDHPFDATLASLDKRPEQIARDFLRHIASHLRETIESNVGRNVPETLPLDMVVSYPSTWTEPSKRRYFYVIESSFDLFPRLRHIYFVDEAEAAVQMAFLSARTHSSYMPQKGTSVVLCDTEHSDVKTTAVTYRLDEVDHDSWKARLCKIGYISHARAGWPVVDNEFESFVKDRLAPEELEDLGLTEKKDVPKSPHDSNPPIIIVRLKWNMICNRFEPVMHGFDGLEQKLGYFVQLPRGIGTVDDAEKGIMNGALKISVDDLKKMFAPSIKALVTLLSHQIAFADHSRSPVKAIMLTGPFANQQHVYTQLEAFGRAQGIQVLRSTEPGSDTARGSIAHALGFGMEPPQPIIRLAHHFGMLCQQRFNIVDDNQRAKEQIKWMFRKRDPLFLDEDKPRVEKLRLARCFRLQDSLPGMISRVAFVICSADTPPSRLQDADPKTSKIASLDFELSSIPDNKRRLLYQPQESNPRSWFVGKNKTTYFEVVLEITVQIVLPNVRVTISCGEHFLAEKTLILAS